MPTAVVQRAETVVVQWVEAFNARDLEGMLACLDERVEFRPLRLSGVSGCYRGHSGVCEWFMRLRHSRHDHAIDISEARAVGAEYVVATGSIHLDGETDIGSFCAVNRVDEGLIQAAYHYLTDADMIERLGLIP